MRAILLAVTLLLGTSVFAQDQLVCGMVVGSKGLDKTINIVRENMGNGSYTEYTTAELKLKGFKMEVVQVFENISIELKNAKGVTKMRAEGENKVGVDINPDTKNTINASCVIVREK